MPNIRTLNDVKSGGGGGGGRGGGGNPPSGGGGPPGGFGGLGGLFSGLGGFTGGSNADSKNIIHVKGDNSAFQAQLKAAGSKLVVVDFTATWCGPCKMIAPVFSELADKYTDVVFLKVDVDESSDIARSCGIRSMPTFQFYINSSKVHEFSGASPDKLRSEIDRLRGSAASSSSSSSSSSSITGGGYVLGGTARPQQPSSMTSSPSPMTSTTSTTSPSSESSSTSSSSAPATTTSGEDELFIGNLMEMGFSREQSERALRATGGKSVEAAMDWCFSHPEDAEGQTLGGNPQEKPANSGGAAADGTSPMEVDEKPVQEEQAPKQLTAEEKEAQKKRLEEKIRLLREAKAKDEAEREIEREKARRTGGKEATEAKRLWEENRKAREELARKKEKEDEKRAKERLKAKLEQDKRERAAQKAAASATSTTTTTTTTTTAPTQQSTQPQQSVPGTKKEYTECAIQVRLPDGNVIKASFKPLDTVRTVHDHIALLTNTSNFALMTTFPRRVFAPNDPAIDSTTLTQAEAVPTGTFIVTKP